LQNFYFYFSQKADVQYKRRSLESDTKNQLDVVRRKIDGFGCPTIQRSPLLWRFFRRGWGVEDFWKL